MVSVALGPVAVAVSGGLVGEVVGAASCAGDDVVDDKRAWVQVRERVVDGFAADVAAGSATADRLPVTLSLS